MREVVEPSDDENKNSDFIELLLNKRIKEVGLNKKIKKFSEKAYKSQVKREEFSEIKQLIGEVNKSIQEGGSNDTNSKFNTIERQIT